MTIGRRIDQRRFIGRGPLDWKTLMLVAAHHLRAVSSCQNPETGHKTLSGVRIDLKPRNPKIRCWVQQRQGKPYLPHRIRNQSESLNVSKAL